MERKYNRDTVTESPVKTSLWMTLLAVATLNIF